MLVEPRWPPGALQASPIFRRPDRPVRAVDRKLLPAINIMDRGCPISVRVCSGVPREAFSMKHFAALIAIAVFVVSVAPGEILAQGPGTGQSGPVTGLKPDRTIADPATRKAMG